jgi:hypothetical protein
VLFGLFWLGAVAMRGAGCTLNDILDREIDAKVERTRHRPLPSGAVTVRDAILFMLALAAVGALVLFSLNRVSILLGFAILAAILPRAQFQLGRADRLGRDRRPGRLAGAGALSGRHRLDARLRHDLCPPGQG